MSRARPSSTVGLYLHALRTVRGRQLAGRARRPFTRRLFPDGAPPPFEPPSAGVALWRSPAFEPVELAGAGPERLRLFHSHYGDDVLARARNGLGGGAADTALAWIAANPPAPGDAWHPYTTSTRVGNWIAACALEPAVADAVVVESLWRQLRHLAVNVEDDILGNHLIRNARALVLGGVSFGDAALLERGASILRRELQEQILADGGHYERSPAYHLVVLRDLLEIAAVRPDLVPGDTIERMRSFGAALRRPDGVPALFNDGSIDLAPRLELPDTVEMLSVLPASGYAVLRLGELWLAFDAGPPAPTFLPPHAHADGLSFQLWYRNEQIVPDPGTSTYEAGPVRERERGTRAHSTVEIDGGSQFEPWGAFRAGRFPRIELLEATERRLSGLVVWRNGVRHVRTITVDAPSTLEIVDRVEGAGRHHVVSSLPVVGAAGITGIGDLPLRERSGEYAERLYERRPCRVMTLEGQLRLPATIGWRIVLDPSA